MSKNPFRQNPKTSNAFQHKKFNSFQQKNHRGTKRPHEKGEKELNDKELEWGKVKFNPIKTISYENPTPWSHYKQELIQKQQEEEHEKALDMNSDEAKNIMKQRELNYRKMCMLGKRNEPTQWEDFDNDLKQAMKKRKSKKNRSNFDNKKLTAEQNNLFRKVITKTANLAASTSLKSKVAAMKRRDELMEKKSSSSTVSKQSKV